MYTISGYKHKRFIISRVKARFQKWIFPLIKKALGSEKKTLFIVLANQRDQIFFNGLTKSAFDSLQ